MSTPVGQCHSEGGGGGVLEQVVFIPAVRVGVCMIYISGLCLYHVSMKVSAGSTSADGGGATGDFSEAVRVCLVLCQQRLVQ